MPKHMLTWLSIGERSRARVEKPTTHYIRSFQLLSTEISDATNAAEYLSQKRAWGEDRLAVARTLSLVSPAGHSLVSWAAACGQTEVVEVLMDHGATAGPGDETRAVSASILQVKQAVPCAWETCAQGGFGVCRTRLSKHCACHASADSAVRPAGAKVTSRSPHPLFPLVARRHCLHSRSTSQAFYRYRRWVRQRMSPRAAGGVETGVTGAEGGQAMLKRRMQHAVELLGRHAALARLRRTRRLPLIEAAYNGHHEVLQVHFGRASVCFRAFLYMCALRPHPDGSFISGTCLRGIKSSSPGELLSTAVRVIWSLWRN